MAILLLVGWIVFVVSVNYNHNMIRKYVPKLDGDKEYMSFMIKRSFALVMDSLKLTFEKELFELFFKNFFCRFSSC